MATKSKPLDETELEAELLRLNALVRERRKQLAQLKNCPNPQCPCRVVWHDVIEQNLTSQVGKIRHKVRTPPGRVAKAKRARGRRSG